MRKKKQSVVEQRILNQKEKLLEHLTESGNVSFACKRVGLERKTYYRWKEDDAVFSEEADVSIASGKSFINDLAHTQLIRNIQEGDMQAVKFHLVSCHPDYRVRPPIQMAEHPGPVAVINITSADDNPELVKKMRVMASKARGVSVNTEVEKEACDELPALPDPIETSKGEDGDDSLPESIPR